MPAIKPNSAPTGDALLTETPKLSDTRKEFDFKAGLPDERQDPVGWRVYLALSRQHKLAHEGPDQEKYPHPEGRVVSLSEIESRGLSLENLSVPAKCCGQ